MFKAYSLASSRSRITEPDVITVTMRVKGERRTTNSSDINVSCIANPAIDEQWLQVGDLNGTLALLITPKQTQNAVRVSVAGSNGHGKSYMVSSKPACTVIFKHFNEPLPMQEDETKTLFIRATKIADGMFTLSLLRKQSK